MIQCTHDGLTQLWKGGTATVYAGSRFDVSCANLQSNDLVISLDGSNKVPGGTRVRLNTGARARFASLEIKDPPAMHISIDWKDMGVPSIPAKYWVNLLKAIHNVDGKVLIHCVGGHGRTGTLLAILAGLTSRRKNPIAHVRRIYCAKAVETKEQVEYVGAMLGRKIKAAPAKPPMLHLPVNDKQWKDFY